jgi:acetyltransferase
VLPANWSRANPVDIIGDATPERFEAAARAVLGDPGADAVLVMACPTALTDLSAAAHGVIRAAKASRKPVLTCWLGDPAARPSRALFAEQHIPTFETPEEAVDAFAHLVQRRQGRRLLDEAPGDAPAAPDRQEARRILARAKSEGRETLSEPEAKALLSAYGVPALESRVAGNPREAGEIARAWRGPFALKILSHDIAHKSDVGGVALNLATPEAVETAARDMIGRVAIRAPGARIDGVIVQQMAVRPLARELIVGIARDRVFGPVILFGQGGVEVEIAADRVMGLPPLNRPLAHDMIARTRAARRLEAFRDRPAANKAAIAQALIAVSNLSLDFPEIAELDINPLSADGSGVLALDARVRLAMEPPPPPALGPLTA